MYIFNYDDDDDGDNDDDDGDNDDDDDGLNCGHQGLVVHPADDTSI
jgi:hypothetical protein